MQLHITRVFRTDKDKNGAPLISAKNKKPYSKLSIKSTEYGDRWIGGFGNPYNASWKEGDVVDVDVEDTGQYLNFSRPDPVKSLEQRVKNLEQRMLKLEGSGTTQPSTAVYDGPPDQQDGEINVEDIPF